MAATVLYPQEERAFGGERAMLHLYLISAVFLFMIMMLAGVSMRMGQAGWITVAPNRFYEVLSLHGSGMVGTASLATTAIMWYFLRQYVRLHLWAFITNYVLFMLGVLCIVLSIFVGGYGALWTFLFPLPVQGMGLWDPDAGALFMFGYVLIGTGQLLFYLDAAAGIIARYGNLGRAMGLQWLFGGTVDPQHPKTVIASTGVLIANSLGLVAGTVVLVMSLINVFFPSVELDPLLAKNLISWFGHMYANATIYMGVIVVYELLPRYSGKPYVVSRAFIWAWLVSAAYVIVVFPHHLFMDFAQPRWLSVTGQIASWVGGFPVFVVTAYGALANVHRSGMRWNMPAKLLMLSMFGWSAGVVPAIMDGTIRVNNVMHNTQWVPGHFHTYMLLGVLAMVLAFTYHIIGLYDEQRAPFNSGADRVGFPVYFIGGLILVYGFLSGGHSGVPRRMSDHLDAWMLTDRIGSVGGSLVVLAMLYFAVRITLGLWRAQLTAAPAAGSRSNDAG